MRTPDQMYEEAMKVCLRVAMTEGDHYFDVYREEYFKLHAVPTRSWVGTAMDRDGITGKPKRLCGLVLRIKEDIVDDAFKKMDTAFSRAGDAMEQVGKAFDRVFNK
jgi:hypothetical protein